MVILRNQSIARGDPPPFNLVNMRDISYSFTIDQAPVTPRELIYLAYRVQVSRKRDSSMCGVQSGDSMVNQWDFWGLSGR